MAHSGVATIVLRDGVPPSDAQDVVDRLTAQYAEIVGRGNQAWDDQGHAVG